MVRSLLSGLLALLTIAWRTIGSIAAVPPLPRLIRHNLHPFMKRSYSKVLAGGGTSGFHFGMAFRLATVVFCVLAVGALLVANHAAAADPGSLVLAMPALLTAKELREERATLWSREKEIFQAARDGKRELSSEERTELDRIDARMDTLQSDATRIEKHEERQRQLEGSAGRSTVEDTDEQRDSDEQKSGALLRAWMTPDELRTDEQVELLRTNRVGNRFALKLMDARQARAIRESRAMGSTATAGGEFKPQGFRAVLEEAIATFGGVRRTRATILRTADGNKIPMPTSDDTGNEGQLLGESAEDGTDDPETGSKDLDAYKYSSKILRVPLELIQDSAFDIDGYAGKNLGERIGRITSRHFTTGTGINQPEGVVTGSVLGKTAAGVAAVTYAELLDLFHSVDVAYRQLAEWMFADTTLRYLKGLLDSQNRPLWVPGIALREPDTLLGKPYVVSAEMPDMAAETKSVLFGDFSKFFIRDVMDVHLVKLVERYAEFHQVGFVAIGRNDSVLLDAGTGPIKHLAQAAA